MRNIRIFDTTLRDGEQSPGCSMDLYEKLEVAKALESLGVDVIEAGFPIASEGDAASVAKIAAEIRNVSVAGLARAVMADIDAAWEAVRHGTAPVLHVFLATSPIHMQYKLRMQPDDVVRLAGEAVAYAARLCPTVEFSAEDATRSDPDFLCRVFSAAVRSGASVLNIPDTVGYALPAEMDRLVRYVAAHTDGVEKAILSVHCHDDLGLATANTLAAIGAGVSQVECTLNGIGERAGNAALEEIVMAIQTRRSSFDAETNIHTRHIYHASRVLESIIHTPISPNKSVIGENVFAHESGVHQHGVMAARETYEIFTPESIGVPQNQIILGKHSGRHAFEERLVSLGYTALSAERIDELFDQFKRLCDKKKNITDRDIVSLAGRRHDSVPAKYKLSSFVINSGNTIPATARITLDTADGPVDCVAVGDGPVDACFKAIDSLVGSDFVLSDYTIRAVTEGGDALGEAVIRLARGDRKITTRGVSTDIIEASLKAYINAVNRLLAD